MSRITANLESAPIVTMLCDSGMRSATLFNPEWLAAKELPVPEWLVR